MVRRVMIGAALVALVAGACTATPEQVTPSETPSPSPSVTADPSASPSPSESPVALKLEDLRLLYDVLPETGAFEGRKTFIGNVPSMDSERISSSFTRGRITAHPMAHTLAMVEKRQDGSWSMRVGTGSGRLRFSNIHSTPEWISSVLLPAEGGPIFFFTVDADPADESFETNPRETLWRTYLDGYTVDRIARFTARPGEYLYRTLHAFDPVGGGIIWSRETREGAGGHRDLSITDIESGTTRRLGLPGLESRVYPGQLAVAHDASRFFHIADDNRIIETTVDGGAERVLFEGSGDGQRYVTGLHVSTGDDRLAFATASDTWFGGTYVEGTRPAVHTLALSDGSVEEVYRSKPHKAAEPHSWAPEDRYLYLWVSSTEYPHLILDLETGDTIAMPMHSSFVTWLASYG